MAIKDQCLGCRHFTGENSVCPELNAFPAYDHTSCPSYSKKGSINLDKTGERQVQPPAPSTPSPVPSPVVPSSPAPSSSGSQPVSHQRMFSHIFSFEGRIRRTEYCLTYIIYLVYYAIYMAVIESESTFLLLLALASLIPAMWILYAQGAKRCHDMDNSGWYQLIPFYVLWMFFAAGNTGRNSYGEDPKA